MADVICKDEVTEEEDRPLVQYDWHPCANTDRENTYAGGWLEGWHISHLSAKNNQECWWTIGIRKRHCQIVPCGVLSEHSPADTLILDVWPAEPCWTKTRKSCYFRPPSCGLRCSSPKTWTHKVHEGWFALCLLEHTWFLASGLPTRLVAACFPSYSYVTDSHTPPLPMAALNLWLGTSWPSLTLFFISVFRTSHFGFLTCCKLSERGRPATQHLVWLFSQTQTEP